MSKVLTDDANYTAIGNAIRSKNGESTRYKPGDMAAAIGRIEGGYPEPTGTITINQNGTHNVNDYASADVDVPNSYAAEDEGKVVSGGVLVAQTSGTATQNGTVDTTLINSLTVNVSGGGGSLPSGLHIGTAAPTAADGSDGDTWWESEDMGAAVTSNGTCIVYSDQKVAYSWAVEIQFSLKVAGTGCEQIASSAWSPASNIGFFTIGFASGINGALMAWWSKDNSSAPQTYTSTNLTKQNFLGHSHTIRLDAGKVYEDGVLVHTFSNAPGSSVLGNFLCLFATKTSGNPSNPATHAAIYYCKIWDDEGTLMRHFLPYNDNGTGKVQDAVTGTVYNTTGTALEYTPKHIHLYQEYIKDGDTWRVIE